VESPTSAEAAVLVADDEPQLLRLMERLTRKAGYRVLTARDGNEAVEVFGAQPDDISVVVLDAAIVPYGSRRVLENIVGKSQRVGVVLISGDVLDDPLQALMLEHDGVYLHKPFPPAAYLQALEDSLVKGDA
jgi:CheY-like chemotaxis protein